MVPERNIVASRFIGILTRAVFSALHMSDRTKGRTLHPGLVVAEVYLALNRKWNRLTPWTVGMFEVTTHVETSIM